MDGILGRCFTLRLRYRVQYLCRFLLPLDRLRRSASLYKLKIASSYGQIVAKALVAPAADLTRNQEAGTEGVGSSNCQAPWLPKYYSKIADRPSPCPGKIHP